MARMNKRNAKPRNTATTPIATTGYAFTAEGGKGWQRTPKGELFLAAVTSLNEDTFYETANNRTKRIQTLTASPEIVNSPEWTLGMVRWLRQEVGLRSIPTVVAISAVKERLDAGLTGTNRQIVEAAIGRLDEASDVLAGWMSLYGRNIPSCVRRGVADALRARLSERSYLKWVGRMSAGSVTLRDVINLTHPKPKTKTQEALIKYALDEGYGKKGNDKQLPIIRARRQFLAMDRDTQIRALTGPDAKNTLREAALTHEVIAGSIGTIPADVWETLVPEMGYMALRMNLRRIEASGASRSLVATINERLSDVEETAKSRTMPVAFYSAYKNAPLAFAAALQDAANASLENVPALKGSTLVLLDRSGSMSGILSAKSSLTCQDTANVFAAALALRGENVRSSYSGDTAHLTSGETVAIDDITVTHPLNVIAERAVTANTVTAGIVVGFVLLLAILLRPTDVTDARLLEKDLTGAFEWPTPTTSEKQRQKARERRQQRLEEFAAAQAEADTLDAEPQNHTQEQAAGVEFLETRLSEGDANE